MKCWFIILISIGIIGFSLLMVQKRNNEHVRAKGDMAMKITSSAFAHGESIPSKYTCDSENISPPLAWQGIPTGTKSLVIICDDPDAPRGTWVHWVVFNLSPGITSLPEGVRIADYSGALEGNNSWGDAQYGGPCPPDGQHRYFFKLYALDAMLDLETGVHKEVIMKHLESDQSVHVLAKSELMGVYKRPSTS